MDIKIQDFIDSSQVLTLAVCHENTTYVANCFYVFDREEYYLIFKSDSDSKHIQWAIKNNNVAVSIFENSGGLSNIKGVQINARFDFANKKYQAMYYKKYPFAKLSQGEVYVLEILWVKYTDNKLLLPKKIEYHR